MALRVWLPLDGTLENKGISNITTSGTPQYKTGKIGQYSLNIKQQISITCPQLANLQTFSICFWGMSESSDTLTGNWQDLIGFTDIHSNGNSGVFRWESGYSGYPGIHWHDNATYALTNGSATHINVHDKWCHCCVVFDMATSKVYSYANGVLITTTSHLGGHFNSNGAFYLGQTNAIEGRITDVRIYDHALSAAEVHEISQGLVLHYKLDDIQMPQDKNLVTGVTKGGQTALLTDGRIGVITSGTNADTYFTINLSESITNGTTYMFECDASGIGDDTYWNFPFGAQGNSTLPCKIYNGHNKYIFTANDINWGTNRLFMDDIKRDYANRASFYNFRLFKTSESGFTIEDSSGYGHNGTINGTLTLDSNTARYSTSIFFNGNDAAIQTPFNSYIKTDDCTVSVWTYKTSIGTKNYQTILGGPSGFELEARSGSSTDPVYRIHNWGGGTTAYEFNKWNLFTFVRTASDSKLYVNGELKLTGSAGSIPNGNYFVGAWKTATQQNYEGWMSDFRIYCTALSAADVKQLYEMGAKVDNKQNLHTYEAVESKSSIKITKQGQIQCGEFQENTATKFYKTDKIIETNNLIEL